MNGPIERSVTGIAIVASLSDVLTHSNDAEKETNSTSYVKLKEIKLTAALKACRLKLDFTRTGVGMAYARVYKNGVATGTEWSDNSGGYVTKSEDFADWALGDLIQVYAKIDAATSTKVKNVRFYYSLGFLHTNQDP